MVEIHLLLHTTDDQEQWAHALTRELPHAVIHTGTDAPACDYALLWKPPAGLLENQRALRAVLALGAGVDSVVELQSLPEDVPVLRVEDSGMAAEMAEYALYVVLQEYRRFPWYDREQAARRWSPRPWRDHGEFPVGVLGLGVLGRHTATAIASLGFPVYGWSRTARDIPGVICRCGDAGLEEVLSRSAVLVVLLPLTESTRGLLNAERLRMLPAGAVVVNLARGPLVVEADLLSALDTGQVGRAVLDVFDTEPLPLDHPFWTHPSVTITPHVAAQATVPSMAAQIAQKIRALEEGLPVTGIVDRRHGY